MRNPYRHFLLSAALLFCLCACSGIRIRINSVRYTAPTPVKVIRISKITQDESFGAAQKTDQISRFLRFALEKQGFVVSASPDSDNGAILTANVKVSRYDAGMEERHSVVLDIKIAVSGKPAINIMAIYEGDTPLSGGSTMLRFCNAVGKEIKNKISKK